VNYRNSRCFRYPFGVHATHPDLVSHRRPHGRIAERACRAAGGDRINDA